MRIPWIAYTSIDLECDESRKVLEEFGLLFRQSRFGDVVDKLRPYTENSELPSETRFVAHLMTAECLTELFALDTAISWAQASRKLSDRSELTLATYLVEAIALSRKDLDEERNKLLQKARDLGNPIQSSSLRWGMLTRYFADCLGVEREFLRAIEVNEQLIASGTQYSDLVGDALLHKLACIHLGEGKESPRIAPMVQQILENTDYAYHHPFVATEEARRCGLVDAPLEGLSFVSRVIEQELWNPSCGEDSVLADAYQLRSWLYLELDRPEEATLDDSLAKEHGQKLRKLIDDPSSHSSPVSIRAALTAALVFAFYYLTAALPAPPLALATSMALVAGGSCWWLFRDKQNEKSS